MPPVHNLLPYSLVSVAHNCTIQNTMLNHSIFRIKESVVMSGRGTNPIYPLKNVMESRIVIHVLFSTLTVVFPCFFLSCNANARVYLVNTGHGPHSSLIVLFHALIVLFYVLFVSIVLFYVLFVCKRVLYCCHRVSTQL